MRLGPLVYLPLLVLGIAFPCSRGGSESVCSAVAASDAVFIGTVSSVELSTFPLDSSRNARSPVLGELERLAEDKSPQGFVNLKAAYLRALWDLPAPYEDQLTRASTPGDLRELVASLAARGRRNQFQVKQVFRGPKDDFIDVWTDFSNCGLYFQPGETYLVYALRDQDKRLVTDRLSRTAKLSDAGSDLAYLFFYAKGGAGSVRLNGFVTSSEEDIQWTSSWDSVTHPVSRVVVELKSDSGLRYTSPHRDGRFVFDGLAPGEYSVSVFDLGYPERPLLLQGPKRVEVKADSCASQVILVRPRKAARSH